MRKQFCYFLFVSLLVLIGKPITAQISDRLFFEAEYQIKFSVGNPTTQQYDVFPILSVELPQTAVYNYPVNSINFNLNYTLSSHFALGIGTAFNFVKFESLPFDPNSYYDKVCVPIYLRFKYVYKVENEWSGLIELDGGYQYTDSRWGYISDIGDFSSTEKGGALVGLSLGISKQFEKLSAAFKAGYEFNQFKRQYIYSYKQNFFPTEYKTIKIYTYYHLIKVGIALSF